MNSQLNLSNYHLSRLKEPKMFALTEGNGSGTKLFQSLLDGHESILMIPGYPLMYFYPFWERFIVSQKKLSWMKVLDALELHFAPVFDTNINPGSEDLNKLGENQDQSISIDVELFKEIFLVIVEDVEIQPRQCLLAFHYAYSLTIGDDPATKTVLVYHIHVFDYVARYLIQDFPKLKVIGAVRDPRHNLSRRELNSIVKPNQIKFRQSDAILMMPRAYRQATRFLLNGLDALSCVPSTNCRVFRHEDLAIRLEEVMRNTASFVDIKFDPVLMRASFASMEWKTSFYDFDTSHLVNPEVLNDNWRQKETPRDILVGEGINADYLAKYEYAPCVHFTDDSAGRLNLLFKMMLPSQVESKRFQEVFSLQGLCRYLKVVKQEVADIENLPSYANSMFYSLKWTNDGIDFSRPQLFRQVLDMPVSIVSFRLTIARIIYWIVSLSRYGYVLLRTPLERLVRITYCIKALWRRLRLRRYLPDKL